MGRARITAATGVSMLLLLTGCATQAAQNPLQPTPSTTGAPVQSSATPTPSAPASTASRPAPTPTPTPTPSPTPQLLMQPGMISPKVRELQARLRQLDLFNLYDLTDTYGPTTTQSVSDFQESQKLAVTGNVDVETWAKLQSVTKAPSQAELDNQIPGPNVINTKSADDVKNLQFRLAQVTSYKAGLDGAWTDAVVAAVKEFQTKQVIPVTGIVDQRTLDRLAATTRAATPWELSGQPAPGSSDGAAQVLDPRCMTGRVLCASKAQRKLSWVVDGKVLATLDARFGFEPEYPTNPGVFHVYYKDANLVSRIYGNVPMPWSMCFDGDRCVHYSQDFITYGWGSTGNPVGSHGCVNTRDYATTQWLFGQVQLGDTVIVY